MFFFHNFISLHTSFLKCIVFPRFSNLSRTFWIFFLSTKIFPAPFILCANITIPRFILLFNLSIKIFTTIIPRSGAHKIPSESLFQTNRERLITAPWVQLLNFLAELSSSLCFLNILMRMSHKPVTEVFLKSRYMIFITSPFSAEPVTLS